MDRMRMLVLGGTAWLGNAIARAALESGHAVTCVARGTSVPRGAALVTVDRDREDALISVSTTGWDAVVDVATEPGHVRRAVRDLSGSSARFVFVSSANAYASLASHGITEDAPLHAALAVDAMRRPDDYGPAKVAGELAVLAGFGAERTAIVRPGLIGGPGDPTGRSLYWPLRFARPFGTSDRVLAPDVPDQPVSMIDVRDLATWVVRSAEGRATGTFNASGDPVTFGSHLAAARAAAGYTGDVVWASPDWLQDQGVSQWMGPRSLPLWLSDESAMGLNTLSNRLARAAGLALRPLSETMRDSLVWARENGIQTVTGAGLTGGEERHLLADWQPPRD